MSTLKVNDIVDTGGHSLLGRRNLIINGAMQVAQRGTSDTDANGYTTVDRFAVNKAGASMTYKDEQVSDAPSGFTYSKKVTVTAVNTTTTDHRSSIYHMLEGYVINPFDWGTSNAKSITLSFWVKGSETGTYTVMFQSQNDSGRMYAAPYTIDSANTWEYKTITVSGDTGGDCWGDKTSSTGLQIRFSLGTASSRQITASTWTTGTGDFGATGEKDITTILNATFQLTGVQLELGSTATPFEHRSYGEELASCQRYYETIPAKAFNSEGYEAGAGYVRDVALNLKVTKRAAPTVTQGTVLIEGNLGSYTNYSTQDTAYFAGSSTASGNVYRRYNTSSYFIFDSEL